MERKTKIMMSKPFKYILILLSIALVAYKSIYIRKLSEYKAENQGTFDANAHARKYLFTQIPASGQKEAVSIVEFVQRLQTDPKALANSVPQNRKSGSDLYFMVKGEGMVVSVDDEFITVKVKDLPDLKIVAKYIVGNAARNSSGLLSPDDYDNTMNYNDLSEEINRVIRNEIAGPFKRELKAGSKISFTGAVELNEDTLRPNAVEIIPLQLGTKP